MILARLFMLYISFIHYYIILISSTCLLVSFSDNLKWLAEIFMFLFKLKMKHKNGCGSMY